MQSSVPDYDKKFSEESQKRMMPALRELAAASHGVPGLLPLNAGLPPSDVFPIQSIQLNLENGSQLVIEDKADVRFCSLLLNFHAKHFRDPPSSNRYDLLFLTLVYHCSIMILHPSVKFIIVYPFKKIH